MMADAPCIGHASTPQGNAFSYFKKYTPRYFFMSTKENLSFRQVKKIISKIYLEKWKNIPYPVLPAPPD